MASDKLTRATIWEDGGATCLARVYGNAGTAITQASLSAIGCKVFDQDSTAPATAVASTSLTVASVVFDTLQTGGPWSKDATGYNFKHTLSSSWFATGNHRYRVEYKFDPASGPDFFVNYELFAKEVFTS